MGKPVRPQKRKLQPEEDNISSSFDLDCQFENPVLLGPVQSKRAKAEILDSELVGPPVPAEEARLRWPLRYQPKHWAVPEEYDRSKSDETQIIRAKCHYVEAIVDGCSFNLGDIVYVKAEDGMPNYIARIVELFETVDKQPYFRARWFYWAEDTVISKDVAKLLDGKRVFSSDVEDDNPLNCIFSKVTIVQVAPDMDLVAKEKKIKSSALYYDMKYSLPSLTFQNLNTESSRRDSDSSSITLGDSNSNGTTLGAQECNVSEKYLLDLYSGCGVMSTGLCMGASLSHVKLVTLKVFMDRVERLKPKHVLMENVVDILKFADGFLGRYAIARLISMNYQSKVGMMAAGSYGVPQFRKRVFFWGAHHSERLPQYPFPTHEVAGKRVVPNEFKDNPSKLERALTLGDAISDLLLPRSEGIWDSCRDHVPKIHLSQTKW